MKIAHPPNDHSASRPNTRPRMPRGRRWLAPVVAAWTAVALSGCQYVVLLGYLIGGPPSIEPDFDKTTGQSLTDKGVKVAVVCYAPNDLRFQFYKVDKEVGKHVAFRLAEHKIQVVNPDRVYAWLDQHGDWDTPAEIGTALEATHVVYIDLHHFQLYEKESANLFRGRAEATVSVHEVGTGGGGERIYTQEHVSQYPLAVPRSAYEISYPMFERQYLTRLSEEIGRLFYEHYNGDDIPDAT